MRNIKKILSVCFLSIATLHNSDYFLSKFHTELPLGYRAEIFLINAMYQRELCKLEQNNNYQMTDVFERMEYILSRLSSYQSAYYDYQVVIETYKKNLIAIKK